VIEIDNLCFRYAASDFVIKLRQFQVLAGEKVAVIGASGSGKTSFLKLMAGILSPETGSIRVAGTPVQQLDEAARRNFRATRIGFVFQELELLDYLNVFDNIIHTYRINRTLRMNRMVRQRAEVLAAASGLSGKLERMPRELSQGERQRAAVCRALLPEPDLLLADEATGNLDPANKLRILDLLFQTAERKKSTLVAVTHDHELLSRFDRVIDFQQLQVRTDAKTC
jgi:ABC-type lipoprotein export system ATPase subunit